MRQKKYSFKSFYILIFILAVSFLSLIMITPGIKGDLEKSLLIILDQPTLFKTKLKSKNQNNLKLTDYPKKIYFAFKNFLFSDYKYEKLEFNINFLELEKLKNDRIIALEKKKLIDPQKVKAEILYKGKKYLAFIRLKGDLSEHWGNNKQWSLKIELKKDKSIFSMNEFAVTNFLERAFPYNFVMSKIFNENDILNPRYEIAKVFVNGESWGPMLIEEQISSSFYAMNKLKEVPIFKMTNEEDFRIYVVSQNKVKNVSDIIKWQGKLETEVYNENKILKKTNIPNLKTNQNLLSIFKNFHEISILGEENYSLALKDHLDRDHYAKILAILSIFGDDHSANDTNSRYYLDPYNLNVIPILTDPSPQTIKNNWDLKKYLNSFNYFFRIFYDDKKFQNKYFETINTLNKNIDLIELFFLDTCEPFGKNCRDLVDIASIKNNIEYINSNKNIFNELIKKSKIDLNSKKFNTKNQNDLIRKKIYFRVFNNGDIKFHNLTSEILKIKRIKLINDIKCKKNCNYKYLSLNQNLKPSSFEKLSIKNINLQIKKVDLEIFNYLEIKYFDENNKEFSQIERIENEFFSKENFFKKQNNNIGFDIKISEKNYVIESGKYFVKKPIIVPSGYNLMIKAGTKLIMSPDTYIKVNNGIIRFIGEKDKPIIIGSVNPAEYWQGIYVNSNGLKDTKSLLKYVELSNFTYFNDNKVQLTGGINFINGNLDLHNTIISNNLSEDAVNLVKNKFDIQNIVFNNIKSDGIDVDFGKGEINNVSLNYVGGDAIDFSGSNVNLRNIMINNTGDKAISVGENSLIKIKNIKISNSKIGIAAKDSSEVNVEKANISDCGMYDYAVYKKKSYFSNSIMNVENSISCNTPISQKQNKLTINGKKVKNKKINIKKLYE